MQLQLNVHRLVIVYRVPALDALDAETLAVRLERWRLGAEHAGWKFSWRDAPITGDTGRPAGGTNGSNPVPSSAESATRLYPQSFSQPARWDYARSRGWALWSAR